MAAKKRVRFAAKSTVLEFPDHATTPSRPSPTSSSSSSELATPPKRPRVLHRPTVHRIILPNNDNPYALPLQLHSTLSNPSSRIQYNCADSPNTLTVVNHDISPHFYAEPATNFPVAAMTIHSPHLPWKILARASRHGMVTISDVLFAIYKTLREPIHLADFELLSSSDQKRVRRAYQDRYRTLRSSSLREAAEEKRQGVKKVDFLMGKSRFMGLSNTTNPSVWALITS